jgi:quercetin dioxygenase-like cupin family protein
MKLLVATVISLSMLAMEGAVAQVGGTSESPAASTASIKDSQTIQITRSGTQQPSNGSTKHFTGSIRIEPLITAHDPSHITVARITFEPRAREAWHTHPLGQALIVTSGVGWIQQRGDPIQEIRQGDVVWIPAGVKHWHGTTPDIAMSYIAIQEQLNGEAVEWMEKVTDEQYPKSALLAQTESTSSSGATPTVTVPDSQTINITRSGSQEPRKGAAQYFTGSVMVDELFPAHDPSRTTAGKVTFEPGARTAWHTHPFGQILIVTDGTGWIQQWSGPIGEIRKGDVVWIPAGVKHWHGATPNTAMTHIAIQEKLNGKAVEWLEKVTGEQYRK